MSYNASSSRPPVYDINPDTVERLSRLVRQKRNDKLPSNGPIDKIPRYDWVKDPNGYKDNDRMPFDRCYHCGYQYNMATGFSAFCNICQKAMNYLGGGILTKNEKMRTRVPDGKKAVSMLEGNTL